MSDMEERAKCWPSTHLGGEYFESDSFRQKDNLLFGRDQ